VVEFDNAQSAIIIAMVCNVHNTTQTYSNTFLPEFFFNITVLSHLTVWNVSALLIHLTKQESLHVLLFQYFQQIVDN